MSASARRLPGSGCSRQAEEEEEEQGAVRAPLCRQ
jgi:hypothetical protein